MRALKPVDLETLSTVTGGQQALFDCVEAEQRKTPQTPITNRQVVQACGQHMSEDMRRFYSQPGYTDHPWVTYRLQQ